MQFYENCSLQKSKKKIRATIALICGCMWNTGQMSNNTFMAYTIFPAHKYPCYNWTQNAWHHSNCEIRKTSIHHHLGRTLVWLSKYEIVIISGFILHICALTNSWQYGIHKRYSTPSTITIHAYAQTSFRLLTIKNIHWNYIQSNTYNHSIKESLSSYDLIIISLLDLPKYVTFLSFKFHYGRTSQTTYSLSFYTFKPYVCNLPLFLLMNTLTALLWCIPF